LSCHLQLCFDTRLHTSTGTFSPTLLWRFDIHQKDRVVFGSTPEFRGHLRRIGMLDCFLTREQVLQDWNTEKKSLHLRHLGIFTEKRIFLGFVAVFLLSRFVRRFLD
jgi:hypothetical protein